MDNFIPYYDKIIIEAHSADVEWREKGDDEFGVVVKIGSKVKNAKVGDILHFKMRGADELKLDEKRYYAISDVPEFITGIVRKKSVVAE